MIVITVAESDDKPHQAAGRAFKLVNTGQATLIGSGHSRRYRACNFGRM